ncbi:hypothetical protein TARUN_8552 [Trichoderma arundinaceum]|uniref:Uncharacterized protein n=1 Tax=Trichoderma arundinaceum TaxID=490622 RepID=A0A395NCS6_TRIAR|nr:hypothetical protein TARUN_8552 [Trichoderma arundinaceum]
MGSCFSEPAKPKRRRRSSSDGETVLVRRRIAQVERHHRYVTDASSSANVHLTSGNRSRHRDSAGHRTTSRRKSKGDKSGSHDKKNRSGQHGGGSHRSHRSRGHGFTKDSESENEEDEQWQLQENQNQVAFWAGESTRGHDGKSPVGINPRGGVCGQESAAEPRTGDNLDDDVSSLHGDEVEEVVEPRDS